MFALLEDENFNGRSLRAKPRDTSYCGTFQPPQLRDSCAVAELGICCPREQ